MPSPYEVMGMPFQRIAAREIYRNPWLALEIHDIVHPNGTPGEHVAVVPQPCSAVVVDDDGDLLFARQERFAADCAVLEIVKGGAEKGESPLECARREVREELGVIAARWDDLGALYEIPSIVTSPVHVYWARGIEHVDAELEPVESVELVRVQAAVAIAAAAEGKMNDAVTLAALLRYAVKSGYLRPAGR